MNTLHAIFKKISEIEPSVDLEKRILRKIALEKRLVLRRKLAMIYAGFAATLAGFVWIITTFGNSILQSDFWTLSKLFFSDTGLVFKNSGSFAFSLLETLPIFGLIAMLIPVFVLFLLASEYFRTVNHNHHNHNHKFA